MQEKKRSLSMQSILRKRTIRDLKSNFPRYLALFALVVLGMFIVIGLVGASESVILTVENHAKENHLEDGQFTVFIPLTEENLQEFKSKGVTVEPQFSMDYEMQDESVLRVYWNRQKINLLDVSKGRQASNVDEIVLEKNYAIEHKYQCGDTILVGDRRFTITGIATTPDYDLVVRKTSDMAADSKQFGTAFVTKEQYDLLLKDKGKDKTEDYSYVYQLNEAMTNDELREYLCTQKIQESEINEPYLQEMIKEGQKTKGDIESVMNELEEGASSLSDGLTSLSNQNEDLVFGADSIVDLLLVRTGDKLMMFGYSGVLTEENYQLVLSDYEAIAKANGQELVAQELSQTCKQIESFITYRDGLKEYIGYEAQATQGSKELFEGIGEFKEEATKLLNEVFAYDLDNLTVFLPAKDNPRIKASIDDVLINKYVGIVAGVIVMCLFTYVISVFVVHSIESEHQVIGALYALGVKKNQLLRHYLSLPVYICFFAGSIGSFLGFYSAKYGGIVLSSSEYFSIPTLEAAYPPYLLIYGFVMPAVIAVLVNTIVINRKLSQPALSLLRNEQKSRVGNQMRLKGFSYVRTFQIRQFLRETRVGITMLLGIFISCLLVMMGINCYALCQNVAIQNKRDASFSYMYTYKYPTKEVVFGGEAAYLEVLKKEAYGYQMDFTILGIDEENPYFPFAVMKGENQMTISDSVAYKYRLSVGDQFVVMDEVNHRDYAFTVAKVVPYSIGLYAFMDIDSMRELFDQETDYYNVVYSKEALSIEEGRLYSVTTRADILKASEVFLAIMRPTLYILIIVSSIIFAVVLFLMMKVMIDRSAFSISLMKIFGYRGKEIRKLYLDGNTILVAVACLIILPVSKFINNLIFPYFVSNVACGVDLSLNWWMYLIVYAGVMACYWLIHTILIRKLHQVSPVLVLKERE